jgi:hypothetical protein
LTDKVPDKYNPKNQTWTKIDQKNKCTQKAIVCPVCKDQLDMINYGHKDIYLNSSKQTKTHVGADIVCKHAHFTMDVDKGRNVWCVLEKIMVPKKHLKVKYVLSDNNNMPQWIKDKLDQG